MKVQPPQKTIIMVFGTFDPVHPGHVHFFKQARKLAKHPYLVVSIARDANVKKIKGRKPDQSEHQRKQAITELPFVDKVVLGGLRSYLPHIIKEQPDIIALGYDQNAYTKGLKQALKVKGLQPKIVRLQPHKPHLYKSSIIKAKKILSKV